VVRSTDGAMADCIGCVHLQPISVIMHAASSIRPVPLTRTFTDGEMPTMMPGTYCLLHVEYLQCSNPNEGATADTAIASHTDLR
jgi:hypothetical protein